MWSINPAVYLSHAWDRTKTIWGKMAIVLFYSYLWITIASFIWSFIDPASQGVSCYLDTVGHWANSMVQTFIRLASVLGVALFLYADKGGIRVWNVAFVTVVMTVYYATGISAAYGLKQVDAETFAQIEECMGSTMMQAWVFIFWPIVALVCAILEDRLGDHGSDEERHPLNHK